MMKRAEEYMYNTGSTDQYACTQILLLLEEACNVGHRKYTLDRLDSEKKQIFQGCWSTGMLLMGKLIWKGSFLDTDPLTLPPSSNQNRNVSRARIYFDYTEQ